MTDIHPKGYIHPQLADKICDIIIDSEQAPHILLSKDGNPDSKQGNGHRHYNPPLPKDGTSWQLANKRWDILTANREMVT